MGSGRWSTNVYQDREAQRKRSGKSAFAYSDQARRSGNMRPHPTLDPNGVRQRESRDSAEHTTSNAIGVFFDVTGSMRRVPTELQQYLPQLLGLLLYKNYISSPQIMFGAIGDSRTDRVPLQVGQFESDNRMDENLQNILLEGGGGGQKRESYELAYYFMAHHTSVDCYEKRGKKGYFFIIGDELSHTDTPPDNVERVFGYRPEVSITAQQAVAAAQQKYECFFIIPGGSDYGHDEEVVAFWQGLLGPQHVILLDNTEDVAETIALIVGTNEGTIGLDDGVAHLQELGSKPETIAAVQKALAVRPNTSATATSSGSLDDLNDPDDASGGGSRRL